MLVHEKTYKTPSLITLIHKNRLQRIYKILNHYLPKEAVTWADFGCSNGFIIEEAVKTNNFRFVKIVGYDHKEDLLSLARAKGIERAEFRWFEMAKISPKPEQVDLATCFETLEHVPNYEIPLKNVFNHTVRKGLIVISVPNETGWVGLVKFLGRLAIRKQPYGDFFENQSRLEYIKSLIHNDHIDRFRSKKQVRGYGPHLGFDYRTLEGHIDKEYIKMNALALIERRFTWLKMNVIYVFRKC